jgi:enoyl-CoA hydratase/carnithine racemase
MSVVSVEQRSPVAIVAIKRPEKLDVITGSACRRYDRRLAARIPHKIAMANKIVDVAPLARATMKRFVTGHILPEDPSALAARFAADLAAVRNSEDAAEGVQAFNERRRPQYKGR